MDLALFIQSLSYNEKKDLQKLLRENLAAPENETLGQFFERVLFEGTISTRMRSIYGNATEQFRFNGQLNPLP
jgi:hypothetical protein